MMREVLHLMTALVPLWQGRSSMKLSSASFFHGLP